MRLHSATLAAALLSLAGCQEPIDPTIPFLVAESAPSIRAASCLLEDGMALPYEAGTAMTLSAAALPPVDDIQWNLAHDIKGTTLRDAVDPETGADNFTIREVEIAGAWELRSDYAGFGGLSGLAALENGQLLAVSDRGDWFFIDIDANTGTPSGTGTYATMRNAYGTPEQRTNARDAEGLTVVDGIAYVGFETDHRVTAFDLKTCGVAARAVPIASLQSPFEPDIPFYADQGIKALDFKPLQNQIQVSLGQTATDGQALSGLVTTGGLLSQRTLTAQAPGFAVTGLDTANAFTAKVLYNPNAETGPQARIQFMVGTVILVDIRLDTRFAIGNFEAIAIGKSPENRYRLWVISDNKFNPSDHKTLLYAFDLSSSKTDSLTH